MSKIATIVYFSGTGNTKAVAKNYEKVLTEMQYQVTLFPIESTESLPECDLLLVGGPIYAGNVPDLLLTWVRRHVKSVDSGKAIVFTTSAGLDNAFGVLSLSKKLKKKGFEVVGEHAYVMPRNFYIDKYPPTPKQEQVKQFEDMPFKVKDNLAALSSVLNDASFFKVLSIDLFADLFQMMAKSMGKSYAIDDSCIQCGKCQRDCPRHNIDSEAKAFSNRCMMCTRCIHNCPVNAISYKNKKIEPYRPIF